MSFVTLLKVISAVTASVQVRLGLPLVLAAPLTNILLLITGASIVLCCTRQNHVRRVSLTVSLQLVTPPTSHKYIISYPTFQGISTHHLGILILTTLIFWSCQYLFVQHANPYA